LFTVIALLLLTTTVVAAQSDEPNPPKPPDQPAEIIPQAPDTDPSYWDGLDTNLTVGPQPDKAPMWSVPGTFTVRDNLGVGTESPAARVHVYGNTNLPVGVRVENTSSATGAFAGVNVRTANVVGVQLQKFGAGFSGTWNGLPWANWSWLRADAPTAGLALVTGGQKPLIFGTSDIERARFTPNGNLLVNTRSYDTHQLTVYSSGTNTVRLIGPASFGSTAKLNFGDADYVYFQEDLDDRLTIRADRTAIMGGYVGIGTTNPATSLNVVGNRIRLQNGGRVLDLRADGAAVDVESTTSNVVVRSSGSGHHVVINPDTGDGNVGLGAWGPTDGKLQVRTTIGDAIRVVTAGQDGIQVGAGSVFPPFGFYIPSPGVAYNAVEVNTARANGEWGVWTADKIHGSNVMLESMTLVAVLDGAAEVTSGDLVAAVGYTVSELDDSVRLAKVTLAGNEAAGIVGVVTSRLELTLPPGREGEDGATKVFYSTPGPARAGDYVAVTIAGVAQVKADAATGPISAGQRLTRAASPGQARALQSKNLDGMAVSEGAPVVGTALEDLAAGQGLIWVLVNPQ
jgi:hypothetical protein